MKDQETLDETVDTDDGEMALRKALETIPGEDGWWKSGSQRAFEKNAIDLVKHGYSPTEAYWFLEGVYGSVAECYGG